MSRILFALILGLSFNTASLLAQEAPESEEAKPEDSGSPEYAKKDSELRTAEARVSEVRKKIIERIHQKQALNDPKQKVQIVEELKILHVEYLKNVRDFNTKKDDLRYRYPDKGRSIEARFAPLKEKPLEELERESGLDAELTRVKKTFDKKYRTFKPPQEEQVLIKKPKNSLDSENPKKLQLVK